MGGWWRWALVSTDGVAPCRMVGVSVSVNLPLHHKVQKFSSGTGSPGWSRKKGCKTVVVWCGIYTVSGKKCHSIFGSNFANYYPIFNILSPADLAVNFCKTLIKYLTSPQTCATPPCELFMLKTCNDPQLSEANCHSIQLLKNIHPMMLSFLFCDEKIFTVITLKTHRMTNCTCIHQPKQRCRDKTPGHMLSHKWLTLHHSDTCRLSSQGY